MVTNAGEKKMYFKGEVSGLGEAWYDPDQIANIFGFTKLEDQCRITCDSDVESAFKVHTKDGIVKLKRNEDGLFVHKPSDELLKDVKTKPNFMVQPVDENKKGYSQREFENAKETRKLYHIIGCPTVEKFKAMLKKNVVKNCPVTVEDVNIRGENLWS
jgi:hypothetical protein